MALLGIWLALVVAWWLLALWPVGVDSAEWLIQMRAICFGVTRDGLPDSWGWAMLVVVPSVFLGALLASSWAEVVEWYRAQRNSARAKQNMRVVAALALVAVAAVGARVVTALVADYRTEQMLHAETGGGLPASYPVYDRPAPDLALADQAGKVFSFADYRGKTVFLTFAFAHCTTMCPMIIRNMEKVQASLGSDQVHFAIVTLDPWRDTPEKLPEIARSWGLKDRMHYLSGEVPDVERLLNVYNVPRTKDPETDEIVHPDLVYVINGEGRIVYVFNGASVDWLVEAGQRVLASRTGT